MSGKGQKEPSDMFSLRRQQTGPTSIPPVEEVLTPPAELRRQRNRRIALVATLLVLFSIAGYAVWHFVQEHSLETAGVAAGETGRVAAIDEALAAIGDNAPGLRARLFAMSALAGERPVEEARAAISDVPDDEEEASERVKAEVYVALAEGNADVAVEAASRLIPFGTYSAETAHAKSLAATAHGDFATAIRDAEGAVATHPSSPRYAAQLAVARSLAGNPDGALEALDHPSSDAPDIGSARARVLEWDRREGADAHATEVLADETATVAEKGWAHLARAALAARSGDREAALEHATAAASSTPPGDHFFRWWLAEVRLLAGDAEGAAALAEGPPSGDPGQSGRVRAAFALARGEAREALGHLARIPATPAAFLLVGRAQQAAGNLVEARAALDSAAAHPGYAADAYAARAELELAEEDDGQAVQFARQSLEALPNHPAHAAVAVRALLQTEAVDEALEVANGALAVRPSDVRVLAAKADVLLARDEMQPALEVLRRAVEVSPGDVELQAKRALAAHAVGEAAEARAAYEAALAIRENHPTALPGLFRLDVEESNIDHATPLRARIVDADLIDDEIRVLFARYAVARGTGASGTTAVMRDMRRRGLRSNAYLRFALAELYVQAEFYRPALGMYDQAARLGYDRLQAHIGRAMAHALDGRTNLANQAIQEALDAGRPEGAEAGAPSSASDDPGLLAARARMEMNLGRFDSAVRYAERALAAREGLTSAHLVLAQVEIRRRRDPTAHLRAAIGYPSPQTDAFALLAQRTEDAAEKCAFAERYLDIASRGATHVEAMQAIRETCAE